VERIERDVIFPLGPEDFLYDVLFPEAAVRIIEKDREGGYDEAKNTWVASQAYGVWKFPVDE